MKTTGKPFFVLAAVMLTLLLNGRSPAVEKQNPMIRLAKLEIHPDHLEAYKAALREEIEASIRIEPGVLALRAVAEKGNPSRITIMEIYAGADAYKAHIESPPLSEVQDRHPAHGEIARTC